MRRACLQLTWALPLLTAVALSAGCKRAQPEAGKPLLFPALATHQDELETLQLRAAGNAVLVTLFRKGGLWRVAERGDWPADAGRVSQYLFVLSQSRLSEEKTANPGLFPRLGVEPVSRPDATGTELMLSAPGASWQLVIGKEHPKFDSNYVRVNGRPQAWLTDLPVSFDRSPASWLDHRLLDLPLARIVEVRVDGKLGRPFRLIHRDDRFRLDDVPSAAMHDSHQGDALASALDQLQFEDLAADTEPEAAERELQFVAVDGLRFTVQAWHASDRLWVRVAASIDQARAAEWARQGTGTAANPVNLSRQVSGWNERFQGRKFLLPPAVSATLMLSYEEILHGAPGS